MHTTEYVHILKGANEWGLDGQSEKRNAIQNKTKQNKRES